MDTKKIKQIITLFEESAVAKMELEIDDIKISLEKPNQAVSYVPQEVVVKDVVTPVTSTQTAGVAIQSPLVGTYYAAAAEGEKPFVEVGSSVKKGDILCIIEAMKVMNEIKAEKDGKITQIVKQNGDMVQAEEVLMYIE